MKRHISSVKVWTVYQSNSSIVHLFNLLYTELIMCRWRRATTGVSCLNDRWTCWINYYYHQRLDSINGCIHLVRLNSEQWTPSAFCHKWSWILKYFSAGRVTTNDELEEMLESGNPAIFTQGVSLNSLIALNAAKFGENI